MWAGWGGGGGGGGLGAAWFGNAFTVLIFYTLLNLLTF